MMRKMVREIFFNYLFFLFVMLLTDPSSYKKLREIDDILIKLLFALIATIIFNVVPAVYKSYRGDKNEKVK